jgi:hypothetical protein
MDTKTKIAIPTLGVLAFLIVGVIILKSPEKKTEITNYPNQSQSFQAKTQPATTPTTLTTTSVVIGDEDLDASINSVLNDVLSEDALEAEIADIDLVLSEQDDINQINNLYNDNEL